MKSENALLGKKAGEKKIKPTIGKVFFAAIMLLFACWLAAAAACCFFFVETCANINDTIMWMKNNNKKVAKRNLCNREETHNLSVYI